LLHAIDIDVATSLAMFNALYVHHVLTALHLFSKEQHGFGVGGVKNQPPCGRNWR